jgi:hypothetical protein
VANVLSVYLPPAYRDCVCFVYANMKGEFRPVGTAFFLGIGLPPVMWTVVVTALHVVANSQAQSDDGKTFLRVNTKDGGYRVVEVSADKWFKPDVSDEIVDIAFCQWELLPSASEFDFLRVGTELAATADVMATRQLGVGNEVAFAGLFVNHHGKQRNEPIVRFGNICATPAEPVSTKVGDLQAYLVESRSVGGLSGSPVFVDVGVFSVVDNVRHWRRGDHPAMYLLGVMNGHWDALVKRATVDDGLSASEYVNMGVALVTPIDKVLSVIQQSMYGRTIEAAAKNVRESPITPDELDDHGLVKREFRLDGDQRTDN